MRLIRNYAKLYGEKCWALIYQADVRWRRDRISRLKRYGEAQLAQAQSSGGTYPYDPDRPWDYCLREVRKGEKEGQWWKNQLEDHCLLILAGAQHPETNVGSDAPTRAGQPAAAGAVRRAPNKAPRVAASPYITLPNHQAAATPRMDRRDANGNYATNRRGVPLCLGF